MIFGSILTVISILVWSVASSDAEIPSLCCATADGTNYMINSTFTTVDCLSKCICTHDAHLGCVPFCPSTITKCPIGYKREEIMELSGSVDSKKTFLSGAKDKKCFCKKVLCKPLSSNVTKTDNCLEGNKYYKPGEEFIRNCTKLCRCYKKGQTRCVSLCPQEQPCPPDFSEIQVEVPVNYNHDNCKCKVKACKALPLKDGCYFDGRSYKTGDNFISADCTGQCTCLPGDNVFCKHLCLPEGISCQPDEDAIPSTRNVGNSNCTCPSWKCVKRAQNNGSSIVVGQVYKNAQDPLPDQCDVNGRVYNPGDTFISTDCLSRCTCFPGKVVSCNEVLCQPDDVICQADEVKKESIELIPNSTCSCPKWKCIKI